MHLAKWNINLKLNILFIFKKSVPDVNLKNNFPINWKFLLWLIIIQCIHSGFKNMKFNCGGILINCF